MTRYRAGNALVLMWPDWSGRGISADWHLSARFLIQIKMAIPK